MVNMNIIGKYIFMISLLVNILNMMNTTNISRNRVKKILPLPHPGVSIAVIRKGIIPPHTNNIIKVLSCIRLLLIQF